MTSNWAIDREKLKGKREELLRLLRQVGKLRFREGINACIAECKSEFCPPIGVIQTFVPDIKADPAAPGVFAEARERMRQRAEERRRKYEAEYLAKRESKK
jgi:hypothetical protein